jgi:hypothetical protein
MVSTLCDQQQFDNIRRHIVNDARFHSKVNNVPVAYPSY